MKRLRRLIIAVACLGALAGWIALKAAAIDRPSAPASLGPVSIAATPDGSRVIVACEDARRLLLVDTARSAVVGQLTVPFTPTGLALNREATRLYVTCAAPHSVVAVVELPAFKLQGTLPAGHTAMAPTLSPDGRRLYVCNRFQNNVSVIDLEQGREVAQVATIREPIAAVVTLDGRSVFVANHLPVGPADGYDMSAAVSVIDTATNKAQHIRLINGTTGVRGMCLSPDGRHVLVTHILARYQMPTTQLERGWMNTNAVSILDAAQRKLVNTVLLDDVDLGAANPWGVAITPDSRTACIAHAGTHELSVVNLAGLLDKLAAVPADAKAAEAARAKLPANQKDAAAAYATPASTTQADVPNDLSFLVDLRQRIPLAGQGPRGVAVAAGKAFVTQYFSDSLAVVDLAANPLRASGSIALGPPPKPSAQRRGELLFNDATICFQHWQSCGTCHPDARADGLNWDLMNDGIGNPKNNKSLLLSHATPPAMWTGIRPTAESAVRSGIRQILFTVQPEETAAAIDAYLKALEPVPSPHLVAGQLSPAARRGKALFHDEKVGCAECHPGPLYTDLKQHDVESRGKYDRELKFDTPSLVECWRTAPYMHDGHFVTLQELLKDGQHGHKVGHHRALTDQEIDDVVEFVLSL